MLECKEMGLNWFNSIILRLEMSDSHPDLNCYNVARVTHERFFSAGCIAGALTYLGSLPYELLYFTPESIAV